MKPNRRQLLGVGLAGAAGLLTASRAAAHEGTLTDADVKKLAPAARTAADYRNLARHFSALQKSADTEAALYEELSKTYRKGVAGINEAQSRDVARALEHVAEHARDSSEALAHLVETYEGLASNLKA
jgi:hypothetical protein